MKIIKTSSQAKREQSLKASALSSCGKCPECGESKDYTFSIGGSKGILSTGTRTFSKGVFKQKCFKIDGFKCLSCGCEWESDPYEY